MIAMKVIVAAGIAIMFQAMPVYGTHPLITDDTGTQDKGNYQLEVNGEYSRDRQAVERVDSLNLNATLTYGLTKTIDAGVNVPYQYIKTRDASFEAGTAAFRYYSDVDDAVRNGGSPSDIDVPGRTRFNDQGFGDIALFLKWRFYEHDGLGFAVKPGITIPPGSDRNRVGAGKVGYSLFFIGTKEFEQFNVHVNAGYMRNENTLAERENLWHASVAGEYKVSKNLRLVANTGIERNPDRASNTNPAFILGGLIYSVTEKLDLDCGVKFGLNKAETDFAILAGTTFRF